MLHLQKKRTGSVRKTLLYFPAAARNTRVLLSARENRGPGAGSNET